IYMLVVVVVVSIKMSYRRGSEQQPQRRILWTQTVGNLGAHPILDSAVAASSDMPINKYREVELNNQ
ncbi:hypothetical protein RYX36_015653, partial [Vicia faba]